MSTEKKRQQAGWWVLALIGLILAAIGIRYASSQGWWENRFNSSRPNYQTINTGFSVQSANSSEVPIGTQPLNPDNPSPLPTSTESNQNNGGSGQGQRALW
ncbi:hypothetical protein AB3R30_03465 [Leptolyngbyaceae cyanobacterium UHCC 1019]